MTEPGTPADRGPTTDRSVRLPAASRYMSRVAASGAFSRKSRAAVVWSASRTTMKPPPPMLPASGLTTARANCTATAASTALPPAFRMSTPTWLASSSVVTTIPLLPVTGAASYG